MGLYIIYFIVILFANTVGALSGMGGGVIIKPALDAVGAHSLANINFFSSCAVFTMSIVSITKQIQGGFQIKPRETIGISLGSIMGGIVGNYLFTFLLSLFDNQDTVQIIQIVLTIISLVFVLFYLRSGITSIKLTNWVWIFFVGFFLGSLSTLLGIGGGPINVMMLMYCFSMDIKQATVYSIITIFFSQLAKLSSIALNEGFLVYELNVLWVIIPAAVIGGYLGSKLNQQLSTRKVNLYYTLVNVGVILLNIINGIGLIF